MSEAENGFQASSMALQKYNPPMNRHGRLTPYEDMSSSGSSTPASYCVALPNNCKELMKRDSATMAEKPINTDQNSSSQMIHSDIDILLIGKTGNGKSKTGNSILGIDVFGCSGDSESFTSNVQHAYGLFEKKTIKVVDSPGLEDTENMKDLEKATQIMIAKMQDAVLKHTEGYHAFLLVVKYGGRFTMDDKKVIIMLKHIFGQNIVKDYCILIMTHGDNYRSDKKNKNKLFKDWCSQQKGALKDVMEECDNRVVLFDNNTEDVAFQNKQRKKLFKVINKLQYSGRRYCDYHFEAAEEMRKRLLVESTEPKTTEEIRKKCNSILERSKNIKQVDQFPELERLFKESQDLKSEVLKLDQGTNVLTTAIEMTNNLGASIDHQIYIFKIKKEQLAMEKEKEQITKLYKEKMQTLIEESKKKDASKQKELEEKIEQLRQTHSAQLKMTEKRIKEKERKLTEEREKLTEEREFLKTSLAESERKYEELKKEMERIVGEKEEENEKFKERNSTVAKRIKNVCNPQ